MVAGAPHAGPFPLRGRSEPAQPEALERLGEGWIAPEALAIALYCARGAESLEEGVVLSVHHGGDSDSTGAIAGHLLGILHGERAIPKRWLEPLELRACIEAAAEDLATVRDWRISPDGDSEETRFYWSRYPGY